MVAGCGKASASKPATLQPASAPTVYTSGSPDQDLVILVTRILDNRSPYTSHSQIIPEKPILKVGGLPDTMPFTMPLTTDTVIVGSVVQADDSPHEVTIYLDSPVPPFEVIEFYEAQLAEQGFTRWNPNPASQVFVPENGFILLCQKEKGVQLSIAAVDTLGASTDVRIAYNTNPAYVSCDENIRDMTSYAESILPSLSLPDGITRLGSGSGGGYEGWAYSEQRIISQLSVAELDNFVRPQLEKAGWKLVSESQTGPVAWSKWTLTDEKGYKWSGVLIITEGQGSENSRILKFQIERIL